MANRQKFDFERLNAYCHENNVTLLEDYSEIFLYGKINIKGKCVYQNCENHFEKRFCELEQTGGYCKLCIRIVANKKRKQYCLEKYGVEYTAQSSLFKDNVKSPKYNYKFLEEFCNKYNLFLVDNYENVKLNAHYFIKGICSNNNCSNIFNKKFCKLINSNSLCKKCSIENAKNVRKETNLKTIGTENYFQNETIKSKIKATILEKYGVEHNTQSLEIKQKTKETCLKKYGFEHPSQNINFQNKIIKTNLEKYGVEHLMKTPDHLEKVLKNALKFKDYTFPSGRIDKIQGYEHYALDELTINEKIDESDIITGVQNVPEIWYCDEQHKKRRHFVDIFIPSQNRCIEVKSTWTFTKKNVFLKQIAAKELGYKYEIWVYDSKGNKNCYDN